MFGLIRVDGVRRQAFGFADNLEKGDGDEAPGVGDEGIAGFVPVGVVLPADDVKEVALTEGKFVGVVGGRLVVVEGFDDLEERECLVSARQKLT